MIDQTIIDILNEERKNLRMYYFWQLLWGSIFLVLVFASSIFFGLHSKSFWIYIIIPLLVIGGFWAFVQSTRDSVKVRFNQRALKVIVERYFSDFHYYPVFNLKKQDFDQARLVDKIYRVYSRNLLTGEMEDQPFNMCYVRIDRNTDRGVVMGHAGVYVWVNQDFSLPEFAIYPMHENVSDMIDKQGFRKVKTKLDDEFLVMSNDGGINEIIDLIGPSVLKYTHICSKPAEFTLTTFNQRLNIAFWHGKDIVDFDFSRPVTQDDVEKQIKQLDQCLDFVRTLIGKLGKGGD